MASCLSAFEGQRYRSRHFRLFVVVSCGTLGRKLRQPMSEDWFEPIPFAIRIFLSALGGSCSGVLCFSLHGIVDHGFATMSLLQMAQAMLIFVPIIFVMTLPLTTVALSIGLAVRKRIAKRPAVWTIGASVATWIAATSALLLVSSKNQWWITHSNAERLAHLITSGDSIMTLAGALGAGVTFYLLGLIHVGIERIALRWQLRSDQ